MELEHVLQQSSFFLMFQMMFMVLLLVPGMLGRMDLYSKGVRVLASNLVSFGPVAMLVYVLYQVSHLH